jgi:hypothetical protein
MDAATTAKPRPYQMIVLDLDGTLLGPDGTVSPRSRAAVHAALDAGLLVCFATGRNWPESKMVLDAVGHYPTAVFAGGAMVMDTRNQVTLHRTMMAPDLAVQVCGLLEAQGHAVLALQDSQSAGVDYLVTQKVALNEATRVWMQYTHSQVRGVPSLGDYAHEHTMRVGIVAPPRQIEQMMTLLRERFGERVLCQNLGVPNHGVEVLEIFDPAVNKWEGVLHLARRHDVAPERIIAVGDDVNDIPMLQNAGLGVAMGNAKAAVRAAARRIIGPNTADGLAEFLDEIVRRHLVEAQVPTDPNAP